MLARCGEDMGHATECRHDRGERKLKQDRPHGAAKDDECSRGLQDLPQISTLNQQAG
jgi:hypothetical protein